MQMYLKIRMHRIYRMKKQMTHRNGFVVSYLFPDVNYDFARDWIHTHFFST